MIPAWSDRAGAETALMAIGRARASRVDIADAGLALAITAGTANDLSGARAHLSALVGEAAARASARATATATRAAALSDILVHRHGYSGDRQTYNDLQNADLLRVIARRRGLPVALSIIWLHVARAIGCPAVGLNVPGHFLIRLGAAGDACVVDPFNDGEVLDAEGLTRRLHEIVGDDARLAAGDLEAVSDRAVLLRLQNNIKLRHLKAGRYAETAAVVERMLWLAPESDALWSEFGALHHELGNLIASRDAFTRALELAKDETTRQRIAAALQALRNRLN
jgi:regulator of sirC expression with transglutaminase-like and TPR domain